VLLTIPPQSRFETRSQRRVGWIETYEVTVEARPPCPQPGSQLGLEPEVTGNTQVGAKTRETDDCYSRPMLICDGE